MLAGYALRAPSKYPLLKALPVELPNVSRSIVILTLNNRPQPAGRAFHQDRARGHQATGQKELDVGEAKVMSASAQSGLTQEAQ